MKHFSKLLSKKSFIVAFVMDVIGILISFLVNANLSNILLAKIGLFFYCIRFELFFILIAMILANLIFFYSKKISVDNKRLLYFTIGLPLVIALAVSFIPLIKFAMARYYYFNNKYYVEESQNYFLSKASSFVEVKDWDNSIKYLKLAKEIYPNIRNFEKIDEAINTSILYQKFCDELYNTYIKTNSKKLNYDTFECIKMLRTINPQKYDYLYNDFRDSIKVAINEYPELYSNLNKKDYTSVRNLILRYGWCWFEPTMYDKFSYDNESFVMEKLKEYVQYEDEFEGQCRLVKKWVSQDSIDNFILK